MKNKLGKLLAALMFLSCIGIGFEMRMLCLKKQADKKHCVDAGREDCDALYGH